MGKKIVLCNCGSNLITFDRLGQITDYIRLSGASWIQISDICGCSVTKNQETAELFTPGEEYLVIACFPRSVSHLLKNCGINLEKIKINYLNFRDLDNIQIFGAINSLNKGEVQKGGHAELAYNNEWPSWFPVIDYARCTACGQCADFCLFGVYTKSDKKVIVSNPKGCKNNCPACGRICPQTAIIFPKYEQGGAIAGSEVIDEIAEQQRQKNDIDTILGSNIYKALEMRKSKRQSIIRSEAMRKAMEEREIAKNEGNN